VGRLEGKVCVITGAGGGMGADAAVLFSEEGAQVCVADVNLEAAEQVAAQARDAFAVQVDVSDEESVQEMYAATVARYGGIDVLYNNAGISPADDDSILKTDLDAWERVQAVNTRGVYLCCKYGIPHLLARGGGSVINVASFVALVGAATSQISYTASKGAVLSMSRELGVQFARERALPGAGRDAPAAAHLERDAGSGRAPPRPRAHGADGEAARDRQRSALPCKRRVLVRERRHVPRRRRTHRRVRHPRVKAATWSRPGRSRRLQPPGGAADTRDMAGVLLLAGGGLVGTACFLPWLSLSVSLLGVSGAANMHGTDTTAGKVALVLAFVSVLLAVIELRGGDGSLRRWSVAAALAGAAIVVYKSWRYSSTFMAATAGSNFAHASMGPGMWVALLGAAAATAAGLLARE